MAVYNNVIHRTPQKFRYKYRMNKKLSSALKLLKENGILVESYAPLYHFANITKTFEILCKNFGIKSRPSMHEDQDNRVCFTRDKNLDAMFDDNVAFRFKFDKNKLATKYKVKPFQHVQLAADNWQGYHEFEERIVMDEPFTVKLETYCTEIAETKEFAEATKDKFLWARAACDGMFRTILKEMYYQMQAYKRKGIELSFSKSTLAFFDFISDFKRPKFRPDMDSDDKQEMLLDMAMKAFNKSKE